MLEQAGLEVLGLDGHLVAVQIVGPQMDTAGTDDLPRQLGHRQAALVVGPLAVAADDLGVDQNPGALTEVVNEKALRHPHLGRGQTDARGLVHGSEHLPAQIGQRPVDIGNLGSHPPQHRVAINPYSKPNHEKQAIANRFTTLIRQVTANRFTTFIRPVTANRFTTFIRPVTANRFTTLISIAKPDDGSGYRRGMGDSHYFSTVPAKRRRVGTVELRVGDLDVELSTDRGVFAAGEVDWGTRYLLAEAPRPPRTGPLLDLGCGYGPIAVALSRWAPQAPLWAVDINPRALELCRANLDRHGGKAATTCLPDEVPSEVCFAAIYSNPPIRIGKAALYEMLAAWLEKLTEEGRAYFVVNKHLGSDSLARWLKEQGHPTTRLRSRRGYRILEVQARSL